MYLQHHDLMFALSSKALCALSYAWGIWFRGFCFPTRYHGNPWESGAWVHPQKRSVPNNGSPFGVGCGDVLGSWCQPLFLILFGQNVMPQNSKIWKFCNFRHPRQWKLTSATWAGRATSSWAWPQWRIGSSSCSWDQKTGESRSLYHDSWCRGVQGQGCPNWFFGCVFGSLRLWLWISWYLLIFVPVFDQIWCVFMFFGHLSCYRCTFFIIFPYHPYLSLRLRGTAVAAWYATTWPWRTIPRGLTTGHKVLSRPETRLRAVGHPQWSLINHNFYGESPASVELFQVGE